MFASNNQIVWQLKYRTLNTLRGFGEIYTHPPARLSMDGREIAGYWFMVKNGKVSGGDGALEACLDGDRLSYHCPMGGHLQPVEIALPPGRRRAARADERVLHAARD